MNILPAVNNRINVLCLKEKLLQVCGLLLMEQPQNAMELASEQALLYMANKTHSRKI